MAAPQHLGLGAWATLGGERKPSGAHSAAERGHLPLAVPQGQPGAGRGGPAPANSPPLRPPSRHCHGGAPEAKAVPRDPAPPLTRPRVRGGGGAGGRGKGDAASARRQDGGALCLEGVTAGAAGGDVRPPPGPAWQVAARGTGEGRGHPGERAGGPGTGPRGIRGLGGEGGCGPARCSGGPPQKGAGFGATPVCHPRCFF